MVTRILVFRFLQLLNHNTNIDENDSEVNTLYEKCNIKGRSIGKMVKVDESHAGNCYFEMPLSNPEMKKAQLKELLTQYGPIEFWWMDHAAGTGGLGHQETVAWIHKFQPNSFVGFNHGEPAGRLCLRERGRPGPIGDRSATRYNKAAEGSFEGYHVAEFTYPILPKHQGGADWFYSLPKHDDLCRSPDKIFRDYQGAVEHGNIFSINVGPDYEGKLREIDVKTLKKVGDMIRAQ